MQKLIRLTNRWNLPADFSFLVPALFVGIATGLGAIAFRYLITAVEWVGYTWFPSIFPGLGKYFVLIIPTVGGLIVGILVFYFAREAKGHGVPEVMEAVALKGGRIRPVVALVKVMASSFSIGSGGSVGREGPIVQIGSALGSSLGQWLKLSDERVRNLVACGAAAGIAATFNAPIAGVVFALEIILGDFAVGYFSSVVVSAVAASVIGRAVFGNVPAFNIPVEYGINSLWEFAFYLVLGILAAVIGLIYTRLLYWSEDRFDDWKLKPEWIKPAIGGFLLGGLALIYPLVTGISWDRAPQVFNVGYDIIEASLSNSLSLQFLLVMLVLKLIATSLTLGSGGSGGVFAPALFMGAMMGAAFELGINRLFPGVAAPAGAYALVGMAALFAAIAHAPITAVLIMFELTGDYRIILPMMLTTVVATILAQKMLGGESIYTLKLSRRGVRLSRGRDVDIMQGVHVSEVLATDYSIIEKDASLKVAADLFNSTHANGLLVLEPNGDLWGLVTVTDFDRAISEELTLPETTVAEIATPLDQLMVTYPDETIGEALNRMSLRGLGRLPVVDRQNHKKVIGLIRRKDIIRAYGIAITRRTAVSKQAAKLKAESGNGLKTIEMELTADSMLVGLSVKQIAAELPRECLVISIARGNTTLIPHGETVFQLGDVVSVLVQEESIPLIHERLKNIQIAKSTG
jgi:CIC family chloride channel protein